MKEVCLSSVNQGDVNNLIGIDVSYALLAVLEFSSVRRRMSVIIRTPQGQIKLLSKGADLVMFDRMADGDKGYVTHNLRTAKIRMMN